MIKKLSALLLLVCMLVISMASCLPNGDGTDTTSAGDVTTAASGDTTAAPGEGDETIVIAEDSVAKYRIVRPDTTTDDIVAAAQKILSAISSITGESPKIDTDWKKPSDEYDANTYDILVGPTAYPQSAEAMKDVDYGSYTLTTIGNKIIVGGWMGVSCSAAASELIYLMRNGTIDGATVKDADGKDVVTKTIKIKRTDLAKTAIVNTAISTLPKLGGGVLKSVYDCGNSATMLYITNTTDAMFNEYKTTLTTKGYAQYAVNEMAGHLYATYTTEKYVLNAIFTKYDKSTRIIVEPLSATALPGLESENVYNKVCTTQFTMAGLESSGVLDASAGTKSYQNGMCFITRLADGSFIIEDGGFNNSTDSYRIIKLLREQNPNSGKPVVAAWIISHAHGDHCGAFNNLANNDSYVNSITVEKFILNQPAHAQSDITSTTGYRDLIDKMKKFEGAEIIKAHPGQTFYIRNAKIDILYTLELYAPTRLEYYNTCTVVCRMTVDGQTFMMLGDCSEPGSAILCKMYGNYLKCDFVQVAHHGYTGGTTQLYTYINPTYVLWPMGLFDYETRNYKGQPRSSFLQTSPNVKEIFVAGSTVRVFPIPFTGEGVVSSKG